MLIMRTNPVVAALLLLMCVAGCSKPKTLSIEGDFSYNVIRTPAWYPDKKDTILGAAEQEVFDKRGAPDFFRIYWRPDGTPITSRDLAGLDPKTILERLAKAKKSWIYLNDNEEVVFLREGGSYRVEPITEKVKLLCQYGDPSNMSQPVVREGRTHEYWQWIEHGVQIEIVDGTEMKRSYFKGTGAGTYLLK